GADREGRRARSEGADRRRRLRGRAPGAGLHRRALRRADGARHPGRAGEAGPRPAPGVQGGEVRRRRGGHQGPARRHGARRRGQQRGRVRRLRGHRRAPGRPDPHLGAVGPLREGSARGGQDRRHREGEGAGGGRGAAAHRADPAPGRRPGAARRTRGGTAGRGGAATARARRDSRQRPRAGRDPGRARQQRAGRRGRAREARLRRAGHTTRMNSGPRLPHTPPDLRRYAWLAIGTAVLTVPLKAGAWAVPGSVGLLSDAAESLVSVVAAIVALVSLTIAARPADEDHHFGHSKAEYFSAALEGIMVFAAAASIIYLGVQRLLEPRPLEALGVGLAISLVAAVLNGVVGRILIRVGTRHGSITLRADGRHLMTDVYTSVGVVVGLGLVWATGWLWL